MTVYDLVGPVCDLGDWLAREPGDLLVMMSAGADGFTMASSYHTRNRALFRGRVFFTPGA